ncbi:MAG TPA: DMT family transporter [Bacteroidales bacterium]|nr:DMT family transporter [Bacteroidales bacterium]
MNKTHTIKAHVALLFANILFGINYSISKDIMPDYIPPFGLALLRIISGLIIFWLISFFMKKEKVDKKDIWHIALCAFFGVFLNQMMFLSGLNLSTPINASIIMTSNPIIVMLFSALILHEAITKQKITGIIVGASGAIILTLFNTEGHLDFGSDKFLGNLFQLINTSAFGLYLVLVKKVMKKYNGVTVLKWLYVFGLFYIFPVGIGQFMEVDWQAIPFDIYLAIAYLLVMITVVAYFMNMYALKHVMPSTVSTYIYSQPVIASLFAVLTGRDVLTWLEVLASLLVFAGVYLVSKKRKTVPAEKA